MARIKRWKTKDLDPDPKYKGWNKFVGTPKRMCAACLINFRKNQLEYKDVTFKGRKGYARFCMECREMYL